MNQRGIVLSKIIQIVISLVATVALAFCSSAAIIAFAFDSALKSNAETMTQNIQNDSSGSTEDTAPKVSNTLPSDFYILLLGADSDSSRSEGEESSEFDGVFRADTIMMAHINTDKKKISLCSFERDIKTNLPDYGTAKLNAAYSVGGVDMMKSQLGQISGISTPYYAVVDMDGMSEIIDSLGGVDVNVEAAFYDEEMQAGIPSAGMQHLDGTQAIVYCRSRMPWAAGDIDRARHQRDVLSALAKKIESSDIWTMSSMAISVAKHISTNLTSSQILEIGSKLKGLDTSADVYSMMTPTLNEYDDGVSYEILDNTGWNQILSDFKSFTNPNVTVASSTSEPVKQ